MTQAMQEVETAVETVPDRDPWDQLDDEPHHWFMRFTEFRLLGPSRTLTKYYRALRQTKQRDKVTTDWHHQASKWKWYKRAQAWDVMILERREDEAVEIFTTGLALSHERVRRLSLVAEKLEEYILSPETKRPSPYVIEQYRGTLDDIAKEKGERSKEIRFTGPKGGPVVIETSWGRGGSASDAWETKQIAAPNTTLEAVVISEEADEQAPQTAAQKARQTKARQQGERGQ